MWSVAKIVSLVVIFVLCLVSGIISCAAVICLKRKYGLSGRFVRTKSLLTCFSGGIFFATSILSLLPEAREKMEEAFELWDFKTEYPLTELLVGVGFLLILTFENISHLCCSAYQIPESSRKAEDSYNTEEKYTFKPDTKIVYTKNGTVEGTDEVSIRDSKYPACSDCNTEIFTDISDVHSNSNGTKMKPVFDNETEANQIHSTKTDDLPNGSLNETTLKIEEADDLIRDPAKSKIRGVVLLVALSFHMVFDGLALGLLDKDKKVWTLLLGLSIHKVIVFLSIGIETVEILNSAFKSVLLLFFFSLVSPIGIIIGIVVTESEDELSQSVASAVLQSVATGTFIYVTFFEILQREYEGGKPDMRKVLCTIVGFALIGGVKVLEGVEF